MTKRKRPKPPPRLAASDTPLSVPPRLTEARILALGAIAYGIVVVWSSLHPRPATWGFDAPGYLPTPWRALTLGMLAIGAGLLVSAAFGRSASAGRPAPDGPSWARGPRFWIPVVLLFSAGMWLLRVRSYLLGDQLVWLDNIHADRSPLYSEPLAALAWRGFTMLLRFMAIPPLEKWLALLPVLCGIASLTVMGRISRFMAPDRRTRLLGFALMAWLGSTQLYCGYFESYPVVTLAVLVYVWVGLRHARGDGSLHAVGLTMALAVATHLALLFLIPSYLLLIARARIGAARRAVLVLLPLFAAGLVAWLLRVQGTDLLYPFQTLGVALLTPGGEHASAGLASHLIDFADLAFLTMPVPALLVVSRFSTGSWRTPAATPERAFLLAAAIPGLVVAAALVLPGSPAQDWDLMSVTALPAALYGIFLGLSPAPALPSGRFRFGMATLALGPLLAFVLVNADEAAGTRRFKTIIDPSVALSTHERAYANDKLATYYLGRGEAESTLVYAQRARAAEPGNPRFSASEGTALYNLHRFPEAARYFEESIRGGLDRAEVYYQLGLCYMREHRYAEALPRFRTASDLAPKPEYLHYLGLAMLATGDAAAADSVWSTVRNRWPGFAPTARALERHFGGGQSEGR